MNTSLPFDRRLWMEDVAQSRAHAEMLAAQGIITAEDRDALLRALDAVHGELLRDEFLFAGDDEDIHMAIERRGTHVARRRGGKLHTAPSPHDPGATHLAMFPPAPAA